MMLNLMENFPLARPRSPPALHHIMIEAKKLAYADVLRYVCDPKFNRMPVAGMLSKDYARERAKLIDLEKANCNVPAGNPRQSALTRLIFAWSIPTATWFRTSKATYNSFGSGVVPAGAGFALQNRGGLFSLDPHQPECPCRAQTPAAYHHSGVHERRASAHRLRHHGRLEPIPGPRAICFRIVDHKMNIQAALEAPRFTKQTFEGCDVELEARARSPSATN